ncbi:hypothetical protein MKW94_020157, partial [Papaver nudicaule]|nr:hypothetical protein [Papaver nudicaule]
MADTAQPLDNVLPLGNDGSSPEAPPSDGNQTPSDNSSPSGSNSPESPPSPDSGNPSQDSPPPDSSSNTPPSDSGSSSPSPDTSTPSPPSDSSSSPPAPPPPEADSSPPPDSKGGDSPPSDSTGDGSSTPSEPPPPPPSEDKNTPSDSSPAPKSSKDSPPKSEDGNKSSPPSSDSQNSPNTPSPPRDSTQSNKSSTHVPELSGPSTHSGRTSTTPIGDSASSSRSSSGTIDTATVAGVTVAGVLIIAFIALFFVIARKRKRRPLDYYDPYRPQPPNYSGNSDGYYYGGPHSQQHSQPHSQQHSIGMPGGHSQEYYSGGRPPAYPNSGPMNSYGSYKGPDSGTLGGAQSSFTYDELMGITEGFSRQNVIGEGGFGAVYKGHLPDGRIVAVKQLKAGSGQGEREFRAEVDIISRVHHRHLVSLVGYCIADAQRLLVYEFVPNNTLEHHIHTPGLPVLDWSKRVKIAIGAARGLAYLHEDCHPKIIHRDIKSANILLDDVYEAQVNIFYGPPYPYMFISSSRESLLLGLIVADFGLAKLSNDITTHVSTRVMGTFG